VLVLNFVEVMALYRAFSVGRFKCSGATPKVIPATYLSDGYALTIKKNLTKERCFSCIEYFFSSKGLRVTQNENYLTIQSP
jgi:hypothetical protein